MTLFRKSNTNPCYNCIYFNACGEDDRTEPCRGQKKAHRKVRKIFRRG